MQKNMSISKGATVLITGASGAVGPRVVDALCSAGHQVRSFSLDALPSGAFPSGVQSLIGNVTDPSAVQSAMHGVDAVVHLAALLHIVNPPPELREKYERINVGGTATVVEATVKAGVKRIVLASTIAVYVLQIAKFLMRIRFPILILFMPRPNWPPKK
jgi:UDP-glucose 4-epimerase